MSSLLANAPPPPSGAKPVKRNALKVMVCDDAVVVRGLVSRWINAEADLEMVAAHRSAREALADMKRADPDVLILDIEMPDLDGITALPMFLAAKRDLVVIMASTLTLRNADISLRALSLGAADYVPKPEGNSGVSTSPTFKRDLIEKVRTIGARRRRHSFRVDGAAARAASAPSFGRVSQADHGSAAASFKLRPFGSTVPKALVIGSSTGGPQALTQVLKTIAPLISRVPVLITQHMPPTFTTILADHMTKASGHPAHEADDGEPILPGKIYIARGGKHMVVRRNGMQPCIAIEDSAPVNFCKPAVDPMFTSAAAAWGSALLGVVLTGMGSDGARGAGDIVNAGGSIIAQDEPTSVVWGMPGATANAGHCSAVLPIDQIGPKILRVFAGDRS